MLTFKHEFNSNNLTLNFKLDYFEFYFFRFGDEGDKGMMNAMNFFWISGLVMKMMKMVMKVNSFSQNLTERIYLANGSIVKGPK
jgi:hypothetical protein